MIGTGHMAVETADMTDEDERWFDRVDITDDPWLDWLSMIPFPRYKPLEAQIECQVETLIRAADVRRLAVEPTTLRFTQIWATFRRHHEALEGRGKHRRRRFHVWRVAALTIIHDRGGFQDVIDSN
jgi:hypothetical protein